MTKKPDEKPKLELVETPPPDSIFDDIDALRRTTDLKVVSPRCRRSTCRSVSRRTTSIFAAILTRAFDSMRGIVRPGTAPTISITSLPSMKDYHVIAPRRRRVTIAIVYAWPAGVISLWPVPKPGETRIACWKSALRCVRAKPDRMGADGLGRRQARLQRGDRGGYQHRTTVAERSQFIKPAEDRVCREDHRHAGASLCPATPRASK